MIRYEEALARCMDAVRGGAEVEAALAAVPERYHEQLRRELAFAARLARAAAGAPGPSDAAERLAAARLMAQLQAGRAAGAGGAPPAGGRGFFAAFPRFAFLPLAVAVGGLALLALGVIRPAGGGPGTAEAATLEGVVVDSSMDSITVQTLDSLEEVIVPAGAVVANQDGSRLDVAAIQAGEVVVVKGMRAQKGKLVAKSVERLVEGLQGWCRDRPLRCRELERKLRQAEQQCRQAPQACAAPVDGLPPVIKRAVDIAQLEDLKQRCRSAGQAACQDVVSYCRQNLDVCADSKPPAFPDRPDDLRERVRILEQGCRDRDTLACRQLAQACARLPGVCDAILPATEPPARP